MYHTVQTELQHMPQ